MPLQVVELDLSSFKYDPAIRDLMVGVGHPFFFNQRSQQFELDKNPFGDPHLVPLNNVVFSKDFSQLTFDAQIQRKHQQFLLTAAHEHEKILFEFFARLNANGFTPADDEADHVEVLFERGKLTSIQIYKRTEEQLDSLHIIGEADGYFLIEAAPWRKLKLNSIRVEDDKLISTSADEEFVFTLDLQPVILESVKRLVNSSVSPG